MTIDNPKDRSHDCDARALSLKMLETADQDALALLERGDPRGFDLAYARYGQRIFGFLVRLSGSRTAAEDLFQHTFMRLAESGPYLRADSDLRAWLFTVARNAFHSHARARRFEARVDVELLAMERTTSASADAGLAVAELERALVRLSESDRELLLLFAVEGLSYAEVAAVLALDQVTVRKRVSRARARLAEALDEDAPPMSKFRVSE
ncbi:MAG TPA: RNA polymerase sigma factor [Polyangiaceae bacterium]|nr:RNA polymerase sigma factor [Polyangiaceae bacterium]